MNSIPSFVEEYIQKDFSRINQFEQQSLIFDQLRGAEEEVGRDLEMVVTASPFALNSSPVDDLAVISLASSSSPSFVPELQDIQPISDSTAGLVIIGTFLSLVIFLSIFGNVLVCLAVYHDRNLRKIGNLFVVSLAIADLFVACLVMTFALVNDLLGYWPFGDQYCDTWIAFDVMCSTASIINLCAISLDRYIHIKDPLRYSRWMTKKIVMFSIAAIWVISALVSFLPISLDLHQPQHGQYEPANPENNNQCTLDLTPTFAVVSSCISFFFPCIVMLILYSRLYHYAQKHVASIKAQFRPVTLGALEGDTTRPKKVAAPYHVSESKAATTVGIIVGTFLVCWVPFFCVNIVASICKTCISPFVFKVLSWFGYTNSSFNPIIYSIFNKEFRDAFRRVLMVKCHLHRVMCSACCKKKKKNRFEFYASTKSSSVVVDTRERRCCPAFSSCCSLFSCYCYCCSCCCGHHESPNGSIHTAKQRSSAGSEGFLQLPHRHQNGSPSITTEYKELDVTPTPRIGSFDRQQASLGEKCLILEQISTM